MRTRRLVVTNGGTGAVKAGLVGVLVELGDQEHELGVFRDCYLVISQYH